MSVDETQNDIQIPWQQDPKPQGGDLISRQAAIDAINQHIDIPVADNAAEWGLIVARDVIIKNLPSAQPDDVALHESCTDCPLYDHDRHNCPRFNKVIPTAIADAQQRWIPVTERLPEKDGRYFVTLENGYTKILGYASTQTIRYPQGFYYISENGFAWRKTQNPVVAWMPLPTPYERRRE